MVADNDAQMHRLSSGIVRKCSVTFLTLPMTMSPMAEVKEKEQREALRAWMRGVMDETEWSARHWANQARTSASNITRFLADDEASIPTYRTITKLAMAAGRAPPMYPMSKKDVEAMLSADERYKTVDEVLGTEFTTTHVPEVDVRAGMGFGGEAEAHEVPSYEGETISADNVKGHWALPTEYIRSHISANPATSHIIEVIGDSMVPTLVSGDRVMVNSSDRNPSPPGIFALWDGFAVVVKRLERIPNSDPPAVNVISDNEKHGPQTLHADETNIIGRVVWFARRI